jgi:hypothetical protein
MSNESKTLRDLLAGVISGTTINILETTATDLVRAVVDTTGTYLKVSGSGTSGASFTGGTVQDLNIAGDLSVHNSSGTSGWFPADTSGNGIALAGGIITSISWPTSVAGTSGTSGEAGTSGTSGEAGTAGTSGTGSPGTSGTSGEAGTSGSSGVDGNFLGTSGTSGANGAGDLSGVSDNTIPYVDADTVTAVDTTMQYNGTYPDYGGYTTGVQNFGIFETEVLLAHPPLTSDNKYLTWNSVDSQVTYTTGVTVFAYNINNITGVTTGTTFNYYRVSGGTFDFQLPASTGNGSWILLKNLDGTITVYPDGSDKIDGQVLKSITTGDSYLFIDAAVGKWDLN